MTIVATGYSYLVTHPSINPAKQGLIETRCSPCGIMTLRLKFFFSQKVTKKEKKIFISSGKIKTEKHRNEKENSNYVLPVSFNSNLTYGLKPQVSGIKIVTIYRRSTFQVEWLIATYI